MGGEESAEGEGGGEGGEDGEQEEGEEGYFSESRPALEGKGAAPGEQEGQVRDEMKTGGQATLKSVYLTVVGDYCYC